MRNRPYQVLKCSSCENGICARHYESCVPCSDMIHSRLPTPLLQLAPVLAGFLLGVGALSWLAVAGRMWGADSTLAESLVSAEKGWEDRLLVPVEKGWEWWDTALAAADQVEASAALPSLPRPPPCCLILSSPLHRLTRIAAPPQVHDIGQGMGLCRGHNDSCHVWDCCLETGEDDPLGQRKLWCNPFGGGEQEMLVGSVGKVHART